MKCRRNARVPLCCNVSGPRRELVKHEENGAGPKIAKRLEGMLRSKD